MLGFRRRPLALYIKSYIYSLLHFPPTKEFLVNCEYFESRLGDGRRYQSLPSTYQAKYSYTHPNRSLWTRHPNLPNLPRDAKLHLSSQATQCGNMAIYPGSCSRRKDRRPSAIMNVVSSPQYQP